MSGSVSCSETREVLCDLIDVRRGELPHPDGTRLAEPGMRAAVESHLASCPECQLELKTLEEVGNAFADFTVSELPAQHFAGYGQIVRDRMAGKTSTPRVVPFPRSTARRWFPALASMAAAACVAFALVRYVNFEKSAPERITAIRVDNKRLRVLPAPNAPTEMSVQRGGGAQPVDFVFNPSQPNAYDRLKADEGQYGYLVFGERSSNTGRPLLGVAVKTTRDTDRVRDESPFGLMVWSVEPGSPAHLMGVRRGDFIVQANDLSFNNGGAEEAASFMAAISGAEPGSAIELHIVRPVGGQYLYMKPKVGLLGRYE